MTIQYKSGQQQDCFQIANWINSVGFGHIEYLLGGLLPGQTALQHLALVLSQDPHYSYRNVDLALQENKIIGLIFSYSAYFNELTPQIISALSHDRVQWMRFFSDNQIKNSWYINTLGVADEYQRQGIARHLLDLAAKRALQNEFRCLSLHVYENNFQAIKLYESYGFTKEKEIDLTTHPFFVSKNLSASILMKYDIS